MTEWTYRDCRLILGDCLEILPTLEAGSVDAVVTDPPYASLDVAISSGTTTRLVRRDCFSGKRLASSNGRSWFSTIPSEELPAVFELCRNCIRETGVLYVFADVKSGLVLFPSLSPQNVIVWDKMRIGMGYSWRRRHEWIAYCPMRKHKLRSLSLGDVICCDTVGDKEHPTEKPVEVIIPLLFNSTDTADSILDPFMGSGTTGVACVRTGRKFIGIEIEPKYFEIAKRRITEEYERTSLLDATVGASAGKQEELFR